jgi:peptidase E
MQRLSEFTLLNPEIPVIGLREGTWITVENGMYQYFGESDYLYMKGNETVFAKDAIIKLL